MRYLLIKQGILNALPIMQQHLEEVARNFSIGTDKFTDCPSKCVWLENLKASIFSCHQGVESRKILKCVSQKPQEPTEASKKQDRLHNWATQKVPDRKSETKLKSLGKKKSITSHSIENSTRQNYISEFLDVFQPWTWKVTRMLHLVNWGNDHLVQLEYKEMQNTIPMLQHRENIVPVTVVSTATSLYFLRPSLIASADHTNQQKSMAREQLAL